MVHSRRRPYRAIFIVRSVLDVIRREVCLVRKCETGGALVGYLEKSDIIVITHASGPGPNCQLAFDSVLIDGAHTADFSNRLFRVSTGKLDYVGDWHLHRGWSLKSSDRDEQAMRVIHESDCCSVAYPVSVIFRAWPERLVGYAFHRDRLVPIPLKVVGAPELSIHELGVDHKLEF